LEVCVVAHFLLQFLQEAEVCSRTWTDTLFILQKKKEKLCPSIPSLSVFTSHGRVLWTETPPSPTGTGEPAGSDGLHLTCSQLLNLLKPGNQETRTLERLEIP
jgi:hypothetical protein